MSAQTESVRVITTPIGGPFRYVVIHEDTIVERIDAMTAAEAEAKQTQPGDLYLRVGG